MSKAGNRSLFLRLGLVLVAAESAVVSVCLLTKRAHFEQVAGHALLLDITSQQTMKYLFQHLSSWMHKKFHFIYKPY